MSRASVDSSGGSSAVDEFCTRSTACGSDSAAPLWCWAAGGAPSCDGASRAPSASRHGGDDRELVAFPDRRLPRLEEPDVLVVDADAQKASDLSPLVQESLLEPGELTLQVEEHVVHGVASGLHLDLAARSEERRVGEE